MTTRAPSDLEVALEINRTIARQQDTPRVSGAPAGGAQATVQEGRAVVSAVAGDTVWLQKDGHPDPTPGFTVLPHLRLAENDLVSYYERGDAKLVTEVHNRTAVIPADDSITTEKLVDGAVLGVKLADLAVSLDKLAADSVDNTKLVAGAVDAVALADDAVSSAKIQTGAVLTAKIAALAVTLNELAANSVTTAKIVAGAVTQTELAANAVAAANIQTGAVLTAKIAANAVTLNELAAGSVTTAKIVAGAVTATELAAGAVTSVKLATGAVLTANIADAALTTAKFAAGIRPVAIVAALPANPYTGYLQNDLVVLTTDHKLYRLSDATGAGTTGWTRSVDGSDLIARSVAAGAIVADSLTAGEIAAGAISTSELAAGAVTAAKIFAGTITSTEIAALTITAANIAANTITAAKIVAGTITSTEVATDTLTASNIAANAIGVSELNAGSVTTAKIAAGAVTATEIAALTITAGNIAAGAITTAKILAGAVTANEVATDTLTAANIAAGAIATSELAANAVTTAKIFAGAVTATEIATDAVTAAKILAGSITTAKILAGNVTTTELAAGSVTTAKINAGAVTTTELGALAVTTAKLAAGAVTANEIFAGSVTTAKLAAGAVTANELAAGAVTANKLHVGALSENMIVNPGAEGGSIEGWTQLGGGGALTADTTNHKDGSYSFKMGVGTGTGYVARAIPVTPGEKYAVRLWALGSAASGTGLYIRMFERTNYPSVDYGGDYINAVNYTSLTDFVSNGAIPAVWTRYEYTYTVPANIYAIAFAIYNLATGTTAFLYFDDVDVRKQVRAVHIEDGTITAAKIVAATITSTQIAAGTITASNIAAGTLTTREIVVGDPSTILDNPNFRSGNVTGWIFENGGVAGNSLTYNTWPGAPGNAVGGMGHPGSGAELFGAYNNAFTPVGNSEKITLSAWIAAYLAWPTHFYLMVHEYDATKTWVGYQFVAMPNVVGRHSVSITVGSGTYYVHVGVYVDGAAAGAAFLFTDVRIQSASILSGGAGNIVGTETGLSIYNGYLSVASDSGATVIIDGTSNMFKIRFTGTTSVTAAANSSNSNSTTYSAAGLPAVPMTLFAHAIGSSATPNWSGEHHTGSARYFVAAVSGGAVTSDIVGFETQIYGQTSYASPTVTVTLQVLNSGNAASYTAWQRHYVLKEAAL